MQPATTIPSIRFERINTHLQHFVDQGIFPGFHSIVYQHGKVIHRHLCGFEDIQAQTPVREDAIYRIYSMTKPVTTVALMMLFEETRFFLDEPIFPYLPEFKDMRVYAGRDASGILTVPAERPITFRQILTHTAGLGYGILEGPVEDLFRKAGFSGRAEDPNMSLTDFISGVARLPLSYQPGTCWSYSIGLDIAGRLISVLSGMPFEEFLRQRLFEPLGMTDTGFHVPTEKLERLVPMYAYKRGQLHLIDAPASSPFGVPPRAPGGGGGLVSTASDYLRFLRMLLNGGQLDGVRVLGRKTIELITANHLAPEQMPWTLVPGFPAIGYGYGLGGSVLLDSTQAGSLSSNGTYSWGGAACTQMLLDPQEDLAAVMMTQTLGLASDPLPLIDQVWKRDIYQALE